VNLVAKSTMRTLACAALVFVCAFLLLVSPVRAYAASETFAVLADPHVRYQGDDFLVKNNADALRAFKWTRNIPNLTAAIIAGDLTDRGFSADYVKYNALWKQANVSAPRIQCIGNHDTNNAGAWNGLSATQCALYFKRVNGGTITSFNEFQYANVMTIGGPYRKNGRGVYTDAMIKQLNSRLLKTVRQGKMAIVVCHYPYATRYANYKKMLGVLKSYPNVLYISGHTHYPSPSRRFELVSPGSVQSQRTPYTRVGIKAGSVSYPFTSMNLSSVTRNHSVHGTWKSAGQSTAQSLHISKSGKIVLKRYSLNSGKLTRSWVTHQMKGTVAVQAKSLSSGKAGWMVYRVKFSDGKAYGGVESGGTFKLKTSKTKKFTDIPAGVLVTVRCIQAPRGWTKSSKAAKVEVTAKKRVIVTKHRLKLKTGKGRIAITTR